MIERPYIGVTGATTTGEFEHLVSSFRTNGITKETVHQPMIGILVSQKTLNGQEVSNRRYPHFRDIATLLTATETYSFNAIHYNSRQMDDLSDQIKGVFVGGIYEDGLCKGLQLNIPWPPVGELISVKRALPDLKIIMQLSEKSLEGLTPEETAKLVGKYGDLVDYALIDLSGGRGTVFQPQEVVPYYLELRENLPNLSVGFAGGFTGENVEERCRQITDLVGTMSFSIDAEGGLRDKVTDEYGDDIYNPEKVAVYIKAAGEVLI
jgi:hypothetical protein